MLTFKIRVLISLSLAVFIALINIVIYSVSATHNEIAVSKGIFTGVIRSMTTSSTFMDDVYTFRVEHIGRNIQDLIIMFEENDSSLGICVTVQIHSFNSDEKVTNTYCSKNESLIALMSGDRKNKVESGEEKIRIGKKQLGHIAWFLVPSDRQYLFHTVNGSYSTPLIYAFAEIAFLLLLGQIIRRYIIKTKRTRRDEAYQKIIGKERQKIKEVLSENRLFIDELARRQSRLSNITKIIEQNKRHFAVNSDLLYAQYSHPYTNLYYLSGKCLKIRCSLAVLEHSFPVRWIRINRSCIVNCQAIRERGIEYKPDRKSVLIIQIKNQSTELEVGKNYEEQLLQIFS